MSQANPDRVLQLHNHHAARGGAMEVLAEERRALTAAGYTVEQVTVPALQDLKLSPLAAGVKAVWNRQAAAAVTQAVHRFRPDVVHVHTPFPVMSPSVIRAASRLGVPTVATLHSFRYSCIAATCLRQGEICEDCVGKRLKWPGVVHRCYHDSALGSAALTGGLALARLRSVIPGDVDLFLALTEFAKDLMVRDGVEPERVVVKPNAVPAPADFEGKSPAEPYALFVGRLVPEKGIEILLQAWQGPGLPPLVIAGDGVLRPDVEQAARSNPLIRPVGWLEEADVWAQMAAADVVVVPSQWYEAGTPLVTIRALAVGTPVLTSDLENLSREVLEHEAGIAFTTGDPNALRHAAHRLHSDPRLRERLGLAARRMYEELYTPEAGVRRLAEVYRLAAQRREYR